MEMKVETLAWPVLAVLVVPIPVILSLLSVKVLLELIDGFSGNFNHV